MATIEDVVVPAWIQEEAEKIQEAYSSDTLGFAQVFDAFNLVAEVHAIPRELVIMIMEQVEPPDLYHRMFLQPGQSRYFMLRNGTSTSSSPASVQTTDRSFDEHEPFEASMTDDDYDDDWWRFPYVSGGLGVEKQSGPEEYDYRPGYYDVLRLDEEA